MRRADRLLQIVQALRRHRRPMTAQAIADGLEVSRRTIYRDIRDLMTSGVPIEGGAGIGYVLRPGYDLPPLMFTIEEVEAIVLGARLARGRGDADLARAADDVMAKIAVILPGGLSAAMDRSALFVPSPKEAPFAPYLPLLLRRAVRERAKLRIDYEDAGGACTCRILRPLALLFHAEATLLGAWCELRERYRFFRLDRIGSLEMLESSFHDRNGKMLQELMSDEC